LKEAWLKIGKRNIKVEIRKNFLEKAIGLMFRKKLEKNEGMLFVFDKECFASFWTFGMLFSIDIVWMNEKMEVVDIKENLKPFKFWKFYKPRKASKYALEVNSGFVKENKIKIGDKFTLH
jgi:uncharacterized membrane protein (UPF0127 family)